MRWDKTFLCTALVAVFAAVPVLASAQPDAVSAQAERVVLEEISATGDVPDDSEAEEADGEENFPDGWQQSEIDGKIRWQYAENPDSDAVRIGFCEINGEEYYFDQDGYLFADGYFTVEGQGSYFAEKAAEGDTPRNSRMGILVKNRWRLIEEKKWRCFGGDGKVLPVRSGWQEIDGIWYRLDNGTALTGWKKISGRWYYLSGRENGAMQIGWQSIDGKKYYLSGSQKDGSMKTGWQKIDGKWYYLSSSQNDGSMKIGWQKIGGKWYYLSGSADDGAMKTGWQKIGGKWYYLSGSADDGAMKTGWLKSGGKWYYLSGSADDGAMKTGWQKVGGKWYYLGSDPDDGAMKTGWQKIGGSWYYFYSSGEMAASTWIGSYYVNSSGKWVEMAYQWPLSGYTYISSNFGYRSRPTAGASTYHNGIDIPAPSGTPVHAVASGRIISRGTDQWSGNYIKIDHGDGVVTVYAHLSGFAVNWGTSVSAGQVIGYVGTTGISTGNHLHLGFYENGTAVSPWNYLRY